MCHVYTSGRASYCRIHKKTASNESARLAMARYRSRLRLERLEKAIRAQDGTLEDAPALGLGTSNLYGEPVRLANGKIDFSEEQRRVEAEARRLGLKRRKPA